ncbi:hypothetical protein OESDEN_09672 [Oesophagostomum dentatum]|uniref:Aquaporin-9 domain protein n=1 Tax=Oesophagostomum dentatum TaxID=61180 RepID=A0A0B1SYT8_OESDE|nr:hypothetical protein OESDEN_09672 [Oesophagostomum dentatum]
MNLGYPINPARDLGPRIFAFFIYGSQVFTYHNYYFWIPIVAPLFGGVIGAWLYHVFVGAHIPDDNEVSVTSKSDTAQPAGSDVKPPLLALTSPYKSNEREVPSSKKETDLTSSKKEYENLPPL